ncbi:hypothetical protein JL722_9152 [Aureococcus anophagefferens]|nr:hypothetical protein JL722_9152 [Aureococcus anophagefferens]
MALPRRDGGHASTEASAVQAADPCLDATALVDGAPAVLSSAAWHALLHGGRDAFSSVEEAEALAGAAPLAWDALLDALALVASACRRCAACADDLFGAGGAPPPRRRGSGAASACGAAALREVVERYGAAAAGRGGDAALRDADDRCAALLRDLASDCGARRRGARRAARLGVRGRPRPRRAPRRRARRRALGGDGWGGGGPSACSVAAVNGAPAATAARSTAASRTRRRARSCGGSRSRSAACRGTASRTRRPACATLERGRGDAPRADAARFALVCDLFLRRLPAPRPPGRGGFWPGPRASAARPPAVAAALRAPRGRGRGGAAAVAAPRRRARALRRGDRGDRRRRRAPGVGRASRLGLLRRARAAVADGAEPFGFLPRDFAADTGRALLCDPDLVVARTAPRLLPEIRLVPPRNSVFDWEATAADDAAGDGGGALARLLLGARGAGQAPAGGLFLGLGDAALDRLATSLGYAVAAGGANLPDYLAGRDGALLDDLPELRDLRDVVLVLKACTAATACWAAGAGGDAARAGR